MAPAIHPGRLLKRELGSRKLSANRLALDLGVPSGRITDILNGRRSISADTAVRLGRYFGNSAQQDAPRHCERSEAIHLSFLGDMDCFAEFIIGRAFARPVGSQWREVSNEG
jgi:addiction module HigA family antidote